MAARIDQALDRALEFWIAIASGGQRVKNIGPKRFTVLATAARALVTEVIVEFFFPLAVDDIRARGLTTLRQFAHRADNRSDLLCGIGNHISCHPGSRAKADVDMS